MKRVFMFSKQAENFTCFPYSKIFMYVAIFIVLVVLVVPPLKKGLDRENDYCQHLTPEEKKKVDKQREDDDDRRTMFILLTS